MGRAHFSKCHPEHREGSPERSACLLAHSTYENLRFRVELALARYIRASGAGDAACSYAVGGFASGGPLRRRGLGARFRRRHPSYRFILDFYAASHRLAIEVVGSAHYYTRREQDAERDSVLAYYGITVLRLDSGLVEYQLSAAVRIIRAALRHSAAR